MNARLGLLRRAFMLCSLAALSACGGGGGEDCDDCGPDVEDADPSGVWTGTDARDGDPSHPAVVIVSESGVFTSASAGLFLSGQGETDGDSLSATANGYAAPGQLFTNGNSAGTFTLSGTVEDFTTIDATYSGANESGTLTLTYDEDMSARTASDAVVNGTYTTAQGSTVTVANGSLSLQSGPDPGCTGTGTISWENSGKNVYDWTLTMSGCTATPNGSGSGVAILADSATGQSDLLVMGGEVASFPFNLGAEK
jgi:hypothetical protein